VKHCLFYSCVELLHTDHNTSRKENTCKEFYKMISSRTLSIIGLVVGALSLLFQLLGFLCPGWVVVHIDTDVLTTTSGGVLVGFGNIETQTGVWFSRICVVGDGAADLTCSSAGEHDVYLMGFRLHQALSGNQ